MVRYGYLYEKVYNLDNIKLAHKNAKKGKLHYKEVKMVDKLPDKYFNNIYNLLKNKTYKNSKYKIIIKKTDNGKIRKIYKLPYYPDRIIHHAIIQIVNEIWYKSLIRDTYSSIKGRGIYDGFKRIKKSLIDKENTKYCLKLDIKKYYPSINNEILKKIIRNKIKDKDLLWLLDEIINSTEGLPIGNYLSQYFGNLYLSGLDHYCKNEIKIKYYFRYADDIVILHKDKKFLHEIKKEIELYLNKNLKLQLNKNWQIFPIDKRGIDFLGYKFFHDYILLRKSIKKKFIKNIKNIIKNHNKLKWTKIVHSTMSYYGWFKNINCKNLQTKYFNDDLYQIIEKTCNNQNIGNPLKKILYNE